MRPGVSLQIRGLQTEHSLGSTVDAPPSKHVARGGGLFQGKSPGSHWASALSRAGSLCGCGRLGKGRASLLGKEAVQQGEH